MRAVSSRVLAALVVVGVLSAGPAAARHGEVLTPPVPGPVVRAFEPPPGPYAPGHRGIDFAVVAGEPVRSPAGGTVVFAGPVAGWLHVTVRTPAGSRVTLSYLRRLGVAAGDPVRAGQVVGQAGDVLHLGVRRDGEYVDPGPMLAVRSAVLVPLRLAR